MERLQQSLGITEEKAKGIADRWASFDVDNRDHRQRMKQLHQQVNSLLLGPLSEEEKNLKIRPLVEQFSALRLSQEALRRKFEEDIRGMLTPAQQGRFILVVEDIQRALLEAMREQRKQSGQ
jgi:Spy/CpxP family protein refolding chaperone